MPESPPKKQIVFVDDEENVLSGMQRVLRRQRNEWDMHFVTSGEAALKILASQPVDLLVTDMKMAGMQGHQLLEHVMLDYPSVARIILSGHVEASAATRVVELAHQFLPKPCDSDTLSAAIVQTLKIRDCIENPRIRAALGNIGKIPALPRVYQELNDALRSDRCDGKTIAAIIAEDMSISAKLLQVVNSSFFGLGRRVSSVSEAVALLGVKQLRALVLSSYVFESFSPTEKNLPISIDSLWNSSIQTANLARRITLAQNLGDDRPDQAYMGGLLHNLGLLLFVTRMTDKFTQAVQAMTANPSASFEDTENQLLGTTHAEAAGYVLGLWALPPRIVESVLLQHHPGELSYHGFCGVTAVHAAVAILAEKSGPPERFFAHELDMEYLTRIGVSEKVDRWRQMAGDVLDQGKGAAG